MVSPMFVCGCVAVLVTDCGCRRRTTCRWWSGGRPCIAAVSSALYSSLVPSSRTWPSPWSLLLLSLFANSLEHHLSPVCIMIVNLHRRPPTHTRCAGYANPQAPPISPAPSLCLYLSPVRAVTSLMHLSAIDVAKLRLATAQTDMGEIDAALETVKAGLERGPSETPKLSPFLLCW